MCIFKYSELLTKIHHRVEWDSHEISSRKFVQSAERSLCLDETCVSLEMDALDYYWASRVRMLLVLRYFSWPSWLCIACTKPRLHVAPYNRMNLAILVAIASWNWLFPGPSPPVIESLEPLSGPGGFLNISWKSDVTSRQDSFVVVSSPSGKILPVRSEEPLENPVQLFMYYNSLKCACPVSTWHITQHFTASSHQQITQCCTLVCIGVHSKRHERAASGDDEAKLARA